MANLHKKTISTWDGGIQTSTRDNDPDSSYGAQMVKHFNIYSDPKKLIPMPAWESFTTVAEKSYGIRAIGGVTTTVYGIGKGLSNWYGSGWAYRVKATVNDDKYLASGLPLRVDLSLMPASFWTNVRSTGSDIRVTNSENAGISYEVENFDSTGFTGDLWVDSEGLTVNTAEIVSKIVDYNGTGSAYNLKMAGGPSYAMAFQATEFASQSANRVSFTANKVGSPGDLRIELYTDNAGVPGTFIRTLGTFAASNITTKTARQYDINFSTITLPSSTAYIVISGTGADNSNYINITLSNSGTQTIQTHTTVYTPGVTNTGWSTHDATATPNIEVSMVTESATPADYVYIYYGNSTADSIPNGVTGYDYVNQPKNTWDSSSMRFAFSYPSDVLNNKNQVEYFTTSPTYIAGSFGKAITGNIATLPADQVALTGDDITVSFMIKLTSLPGVTTTIIDDANSGWDIQINNTGKIVWTVDGVVGVYIKTSAVTLDLNTWYVVDCIYNTDYYITIDAVKETFVQGAGNFKDVIASNTLRVNTSSICQLAQVWGFDNDLTDNQSLTKYYNFMENSQFWTIASQETFSALSKTYSGVQVYTKSLTSGDWTEYISANQTVKSSSYFPVNGFVEVSGDIYFIVSQSVDDAGFLFLMRTDSFNLLDGTPLLLSVLAASQKVRPTSDSPIDGSVYFNYGNSNLGLVGDPGSTSIYSANSTINSLVPWRNYLAVGSTRRTRAYVEIWDLVIADGIETIDAGTGNLRIVGNASDILFAVIDNYIDDAVLSSGKPTMEVREYVGNGRMESAVRVEVPATYTGWTDDWERAVSFFKLRRNTETLFYAKLPSNAAASTFNQGFWAVGKNSQGKLALTLMIDTSDFTPPENVYSVAQQVFFVEKDGGVQKLSTSVYSKTSLYTTKLMNDGNSQILKDLKGIEIVTEPLVSGQSVSVYYKKNGDASRTLIKTLTGVGEIAVEAVNLPSGSALPSYNEIEFDIESTGGKSAIIEFSYRFEYQNGSDAV